MNGYERAVRTLRLEPTDRVPTWGGYVVSADFFEYVTGKRFWEDPLSVAIEAYRKLEVDVVYQNTHLPPSPEEWRSYTPESGSESPRYRSPEEVVAYVGSLPSPGKLNSEFDFEGVRTALWSEYSEAQERLGSDIFCLPRFSVCKFTWYNVLCVTHIRGRTNATRL